MKCWNVSSNYICRVLPQLVNIAVNNKINFAFHELELIMKDRFVALVNLFAWKTNFIV